MEKYFAVEQDISNEFLVHQRISLVSITCNEELEYVSGDAGISGILEVKEGDLVINKKAVCDYKIYPLRRREAELLKSVLEKSKFLSINKRPRSYRKL